MMNVSADQISAISPGTAMALFAAYVILLVLACAWACTRHDGGDAPDRNEGETDQHGDGL